MEARRAAATILLCGLAALAAVLLPSAFRGFSVLVAPGVFGVLLLALAVVLALGRRGAKWLPAALSLAGALLLLLEAGIFVHIAENWSGD